MSGLLGAWAPQVARGTAIIALRDNPSMREDIASCVVTHGADADAACSSPLAEAMGARDPLVEAAQATPGAHVVDLTELYCPQEVCEPIIGNVVVYADKEHLTVTFARTLQSALETRLQAALSG